MIYKTHQFINFWLAGPLHLRLSGMSGWIQKEYRFQSLAPLCLFCPHPVFTIIDLLGHLMNPKWQGKCVFANMLITNNQFNCSLKSEIGSLSDPAFPAIVRVDD